MLDLEDDDPSCRPRDHEELGSASWPTTAKGGAQACKSATKLDDGAFSRPLRPGFHMMKSEVISLIAEQQIEHERRVTELLEVHQQQFLEAMRVELAKVTFGGKAPEYRCSTPRTSPSELAVAAGKAPEALLVTDATLETAAACDVPCLQTSRHSVTAGPEATHVSSIGPEPLSPGHVGWGMASMPISDGGGMGRWTLESMKTQAEVFNADLQIHEAAVLAYSFNTCIGKIIQSPAFECVVCTIVVLNAVCIGWYADWTMKNLNMWNEEPLMFRILDLVFSAIFLLELLLRIAGEGWHFMARNNRNRPWNILDTVLVGSVVVEELLSLFLISAPNVTIVRLLRTLRAVRVVRIFRVTRFFTDLRLMVMGLICAARSLFWVIVLLLFVIYIFAVCLMQITADSIAGNGAPLDEDTTADQIFEYIGSLEVTMYTLYKSVCGGLEWGIVADQLAKKGVFLTVVYSVYIAFATLCILNIVTGVFVQSASTIAQNDQIEMGLEHLERRRAWLKEVIELFKTADVNGSGQIDWRSFKACLSKPSVQACFTKLGLDLESINSRGLFCLFDTNDDGTIDLEEFAHGILKLHGNARSFDLHLVGNESKRILQHVQHLRRRLH